MTAGVRFLRWWLHAVLAFFAFWALEAFNVGADFPVLAAALDLVRLWYFVAASLVLSAAMHRKDTLIIVVLITCLLFDPPKTAQETINFISPFLFGAVLGRALRHLVRDLRRPHESLPRQRQHGDSDGAPLGGGTALPHDGTDQHRSGQDTPGDPDRLQREHGWPTLIYDSRPMHHMPGNTFPDGRRGVRDVSQHHVWPAYPPDAE
jgi:hypothetical protein